MSAFRWLEQPGQFESLAICLRSITGQADAPADYDDLLVGLGLGSLVIADDRHAPCDWPQLARDELLITTAECSGVRLRDLHPRRAAVGLETSAEFQLHFVDSYLPLIERALSCGQRAIAWRGWPPPADMQWGVITTRGSESVSGYTSGHSGALLDLVAPSQQVYIVEETGAPARWLGPADSFARVAWAAAVQESGLWCSDAAMVTGSRAWVRWKDCLEREESGAENARAFRALALPLVAARDALARWLRRTANDLSGTDRSTALRWAESCGYVAQQLRGAISPSGSSPGTTGWVSRAAGVLDNLAESDARTSEIVAPHARPIVVRPAYEPDPLIV